MGNLLLRLRASCPSHAARLRGGGTTVAQQQQQNCSDPDERVVNAALRDPSITSNELTAEANVSRWTIQRPLKEAGSKSRKRPSIVELSNRLKRTRLNWAMRHCH